MDLQKELPVSNSNEMQREGVRSKETSGVEWFILISLKACSLLLNFPWHLEMIKMEMMGSQIKENDGMHSIREVHRERCV